MNKAAALELLLLFCVYRKHISNFAEANESSCALFLAIGMKEDQCFLINIT